MPAVDPLRAQLTLLRQAVQAAPAGRCPACGRALTSEDPVVRVHGKPFHRGCVFKRADHLPAA